MLVRTVTRVTSQPTAVAVGLSVALLLGGTAAAGRPAPSVGRTDVKHRLERRRAGAVVPAGQIRVRHDARVVRRPRQDRTRRESSATKAGPARSTTTDRLPLADSSAARFMALYRRSARAFGVSWRLVASIHQQETGFSSAAGTYRGLNFARCCAGPMQFNVTNGPVSTWDRFNGAYRRADRPRRYPHSTRRHPSVYDDFDAIMAAGALLRASGARRRLDGAAWLASYAYYGHDETGLEYANQVLARAVGWAQRGVCVRCAVDPRLVGRFDAAFAAPFRAQFRAAERRRRADARRHRRAAIRRRRREQAAQRRRAEEQRQRRHDRAHRARRKQKRPAQADTAEPARRAPEKPHRRPAAAARPTPAPAKSGAAAAPTPTPAPTPPPPGQAPPAASAPPAGSSPPASPPAPPAPAPVPPPATVAAT
jgi:hypothetical protein